MEHNTLKEKITFNQVDTAVYAKTYFFIKGYATGLDLSQTLIALALARRLHEGQYRKDGSPYIIHPLKVCSTLISYGIKDDVTLAAALLHDAFEDCLDKLPMGGQELYLEYHLDKEVYDIVMLLTKQSGLSDEELCVHFEAISKNPKASMIKLSDRLHNSGTLYALKPEKIKKYVRETEDFLLPIASYCVNYYPENANLFSILKSSIRSMNRAMSIMIDKFTTEQ